MPDVATVLADLRAEVEIPSDGILSRTLFESERVKVVLFGFDAGQELSEHTAAMPAVIEVLDGTADVLLGDSRHHLGPGAWVHMPAGLRHAIRAVTPLRMLLVLLRDPVGVPAES
ncbi:MAG TPA: cupin domain-containing protein [Candidatus Limnocylindrales bacterium]|nr:cupin domain-containing protein [Candidatus Limnocylindrales bacterium]